MFYVAEQRPLVKASNPTLRVGPIAKLIGALWRELDDASKAPFVALAAKDKERYTAAKSVYDATPPRQKHEKEIHGAEIKVNVLEILVVYRNQPNKHNTSKKLIQYDQIDILRLRFSKSDVISFAHFELE